MERDSSNRPRSPKGIRLKASREKKFKFPLFFLSIYFSQCVVIREKRGMLLAFEGKKKSEGGRTVCVYTRRSV